MTPPTARQSSIPAVSQCRGALACLLLTAAAGDAEGDDLTLDQLRERYSARIDAMPTIWTRSHWSRAPVLDDPVHPILPFEDIVVDWAIDGAKWHVHVHPRGDVQPIMEKWVSFDGKRVWHPEFSEKHQAGDYFYVRHQSLATQTDNRLRRSLTPGSFLGLYFNSDNRSQSGASLATILARDDTVLQGAEEIDGHLCYRVDGHFPTTEAGTVWPVSVWLDPTVGCLPRRFEIRFGRQPKKPTILSVEDFLAISGPERNSLSFPLSCRLQSVFVDDALVVEEVAIDGSLRPGLFRPKWNSSVPVFDLDDPADVQRCLSLMQQPAIEEMKAKVREEIQQRRTRTAMPPAPVEPVVTATAEPGVRAHYWLILVGLVLLTAGTWQTFRRS